MVMASDAFFPFPDALEEGKAEGATAVYSLADRLR